MTPLEQNLLFGITGLIILTTLVTYIAQFMRRRRDSDNDNDKNDGAQ